MSLNSKLDTDRRDCESPLPWREGARGWVKCAFDARRKSCDSARPLAPRLRRNGDVARRATVALLATILLFTAIASAQQQLDAKVKIAFNRFYDYDQIAKLLHELVDAHSDLLTIESIGQSEQGREMWLVTMNNPTTGPDTEKPAMWIDGNVHGNEIQATETVLYSIWYLAESYGKVKALTELVDRVTFYFVPMVNPDGRAGWFAEPATAHSHRSGQRPTDNDFDGRVDEDGPEDLDGDGSIGTMWRPDPNGTHRRNRDDPRILERIDRSDPRQKGEYSRAGSEGIDNDGDGEINEDGPGGYDMNRNNPNDWQPNYLQFGAGDHPFSFPETRAIGMFILAHPNIAAGQSYHNAGGMILRGPGAAYNDDDYSHADRAVYDRLAAAGTEMLPFYDYLVIHSGLYTVHGGFVNWLAEGLGIVSFTNELWTDERILQSGVRRLDDEQEWRWRDRVLFGQTFTELKEFDHPELGKVLIGGGTKFDSRTPPPFMLEEECHRNFAFTMFHADNMPLLRFDWVEVKSLGPELWQITIEVANSKIIPTRTERAATNRIGQPDRLILSGDVIAVVASGVLRDRFDKTIQPVEHRKAIIENARGIDGHERATFRYILTGPAGAEITLRYEAEKARNVERTFTLK